MTTGCDSDCVDPGCEWFFIHGTRSGRPMGLASYLDAGDSWRMCPQCAERCYFTGPLDPRGPKWPCAACRSTPASRREDPRPA